MRSPMAQPKRYGGAHRSFRRPVTVLRSSHGSAFPLANAGTGSLGFDSGELGFGPAAFTAASNRKTWQTPTDLGAGTYTYFCRVHPFMRGSFRVTG